MIKSIKSMLRVGRTRTRGEFSAQIELPRTATAGDVPALIMAIGREPVTLDTVIEPDGVSLWICSALRAELDRLTRTVRALWPGADVGHETSDPDAGRSSQITAWSLLRPAGDPVVWWLGGCNRTARCGSVAGAGPRGRDPTIPAACYAVRPAGDHEPSVATQRTIRQRKHLRAQLAADIPPGSGRARAAGHPPRPGPERGVVDRRSSADAAGLRGAWCRHLGSRGCCLVGHVGGYRRAGAVAAVATDLGALATRRCTPQIGGPAVACRDQDRRDGAAGHRSCRSPPHRRCNRRDGRPALHRNGRRAHPEAGAGGLAP